MSDTYDKVKAVIVDVLKVDEKEIKEDTRFVEDLKADSMDQFFLIDGFCEKFDITCSPIRTCDEQEIRTRYENPESDSKSNSEKIDSYELQSFEVNSGDAS